MHNTPQQQPLVPGSPAIPGSGSGYGNGGAGGVKNLRQRFRCQPRRLDLATYNARTLRTDEKIVELEEAVSKLRWGIIGLSEVRRQGEDSIILKSGNLLYYREGDQQSQGGVGFIVHKSLVNSIVQVESVSSRVAYLILRITERYSLKVIQVYAPTSTHADEEVEVMYEDISKAMHASDTYYSVVMGDFNARLGKRSGAELKVGQFGFGRRNHRGQMLADFMEKEGLFMMNSFFKKSPHRKWTWMSPDGSTRNEIDFIMSTKRHIFNDVSVINRVKTGSDHRMVRGTLNLNIKLERAKLVKSTLRPTRAHIQNPEGFQLALQNRFACLADCDSVNELNNGLVETVHAVGNRFFKSRRMNRPKKFSDQTLKLMEERHKMRLQSSVDAATYRQINRQISKSQTRDLRDFNTLKIQETIEENKGSKVFARDLSIGQSQLTRLKTDNGSLISSKPEILREVERFYGQLYGQLSQKPVEDLAKDPRA